ncbi:MAG: hydrogenase subunit MbhD domain-containing protein [Moorellales bacterium]
MEVFAQAVISVVLLLCAWLAVRLKSLLAAVIVLAMLSLVLSLEFYLLKAPDVAIAEAAIGAGLTTAIFMFALKGVREER